MSEASTALKGANLKVYSAEWCPDCNRFKKWLEDNGVDYEYVDIQEVDGAAEKLENETGKRAIPFVLINDKKWVRGYHKELPIRFDPKLFMKEAAEAIASA